VPLPLPSPTGPPPPLPGGYYFGPGPWFNEAGGDPYPFPYRNGGISAQFVGAGFLSSPRLLQIRLLSRPTRTGLFPTEPAPPG
jgi:hypothetical protein